MSALEVLHWQLSTWADPHCASMQAGVTGESAPHTQLGGVASDQAAHQHYNKVPFVFRVRCLVAWKCSTSFSRAREEGSLPSERKKASVMPIGKNGTENGHVPVASKDPRWHIELELLHSDLLLKRFDNFMG